MIRAVCCGTTRTVRTSTMMTKPARSSRTMSEMMPSGMGLPFAGRRGAGSVGGVCGGWGDDGRRPVDGDDPDLLAGADGLAALGQAGGPGLTGELDPAVGVGDGLQDAGLAADEGRGTDLVVDLAVGELPLDHRPDDEQEEERHGHRDDDLEREPRAEGGGDGTGEAAAGEHEEDEVDGGRLDR